MALKLNGTNSVAAPAYAGADADTGLQCGTDEVNLVTGGTARLKIDSSGNVGVGTSSPGEKLTVAGKIQATTEFKSESGNDLRLNAGSANRDVFMQVNGSTLMTVQGSTGRVGIGTTGPTGSLSIASGTFQTTTPTSTGDDIVISGNQSLGMQFLTLASNTSNNNIYFGDTDDPDVGMIRYAHANNSLQFQTNASERMRIDSSGRLLYGHSTSRSVYGIQSPVQIEGTQFESGSLSIICNNASDFPILLLARSRGSSLGSQTAPTDGQVIGEVSFVPSDGTNYGAASVRLQGVADDNHGTNDVPGRFIIQVVPDGSESSGERFRLGNDGRMRVTGVYQETTGGSANVNVQSDGLLQRSVSSIKYKKDVETLEDSYADALLDLRPVWYKSKCNSDNPDHGHWGFVAEELAEIDPRLVIWKNTEISWDENGFAVETSCDPEPEGVQYERFVPHLLNLIKRQKTRIEALETQQADLLARITALEAA